MNSGIVRKVFAKELKETLRDRRTLVVMLVVPIFLYPALLIVMQQLAIFGQRQLEEVPASVLAQGADADILARLNADARLSVTTVDAPAASGVAAGETDVFVRFGPAEGVIGGSPPGPGAGPSAATDAGPSAGSPSATDNGPPTGADSATAAGSAAGTVAGGPAPTDAGLSPATPGTNDAGPPGGTPAAADTGADATREVTVVFDASRDRSRMGREAVLESIGEWEDSLLAARLTERGLPAAFAEPVVVADSSVATPERLGGYALGRFLPMLLILMTLLGAFYPAIDLSAGEKERGTLETILTTPVEAADFVAGKFLTVTVIGLAAAGLNLVSMLLTFRLAAFQLAQGLAIEFRLPWTTIALVMLSLIPLTVLFAALFLGIALRARSFKEAQNALTPVQLASMIPIMLPIIPGMPLNYVLAMIPVGGLALLFREMMSGGAPIGPALVAVGMTILYAGLALRFAAASFGREEVLFGSGDATRPTLASWVARRRNRGKGPATPGEAVVFVGVVGLLFFYVAPVLTVRFGEAGIMASQLLLMGLPAVAFAVLGGLGAREGLGLRLPSAQQLGGGLMMAAGGLPVAWLLGWLQSFVLEIPEEFLAAFEDLIRAETPAEIVWLLLLVAVTPAICEELVFRGVLLRGLASRMPMLSAVGMSALLFGLFHLSNETAIRLLPSAWLGMLLGYAAWRTRSLFVSMAMHFVNNASIVVLIAWPAMQDRVTGGSGAPEWWLVPLGVLLLGAGVRVLADGYSKPA